MHLHNAVTKMGWLTNGLTSGPFPVVFYCCKYCQRKSRPSGLVRHICRVHQELISDHCREVFLGFPQILSSVDDSSHLTFVGVEAEYHLHDGWYESLQPYTMTSFRTITVAALSELHPSEITASKNLRSFREINGVNTACTVDEGIVFDPVNLAGQRCLRKSEKANICGVKAVPPTILDPRWRLDNDHSLVAARAEYTVYSIRLISLIPDTFLRIESEGNRVRGGAVQFQSKGGCVGLQENGTSVSRYTVLLYKT
ncbi:hypothetical protein L218DRAFT_943274 [Marasmius fiardii PR-910]|nr:hypothetical protein L218DRAFT_943274 [Marasmius fiardii PR-910]